MIETDDHDVDGNDNDVDDNNNSNYYYYYYYYYLNTTQNIFFNGSVPSDSLTGINLKLTGFRFPVITLNAIFEM